MRPHLRVWLGTALLVIAGTVWASPVYQFSTPERSQRFARITAELRCLVCQGESVADSNADLARDIRDKVAELIRQGKSDKAVINYMVDRYGDFILFRPPLNPLTYVLWIGPFVLLGGGVLGVLRIAALRRRRLAEPAAEADAEARARIHRMLYEDNNR